jgi:hypothetical protein
LALGNNEEINPYLSHRPLANSLFWIVATIEKGVFLFCKWSIIFKNRPLAKYTFFNCCNNAKRGILQVVYYSPDTAATLPKFINSKGQLKHPDFFAFQGGKTTGLGVPIFLHIFSLKWLRES